MSDFGDPVVNFGEDIIYGCGVPMNLSSLKAYCQNPFAILSLPIFSNIQFWANYGQFGNANIYNPLVCITKFLTNIGLVKYHNRYFVLKSGNSFIKLE